jgi:TPR repeat protein
MKKYFYAKNGDQIGPLSLEEILTINLNKDTLVWYEGLPEWVRLSEIPELNTKSNESLPPPIRVKENDNGKKKSSKIIYVIAFLVLILIAGGIYLYPKWEYEKKYNEALSVYMKTDSIQFEVFNELAINNHPKSNFILGLYYDRMGDSLKAKESVEKGIVNENEIPALYLLYFINPKDSIEYEDKIAETFTTWVNGISESDWLSQLYAGRIYEFGIGVKPNPRKAIEYYELASNNGSVRANFLLGLIYLNIEEVQDYKKSLSFFKKADELGFLSAAGQIGFIYNDGLGVEKDYNQAVFWHTKGAKMNDIYSESMMAYFYTKGFGVTQNIDSAKYWHQRVIDNSKTQKINIKYVKNIKKDSKENIELINSLVEEVKSGSRNNQSNSSSSGGYKSAPKQNQPQRIEIGAKYKGGIIFELYSDGSGGKVFFSVSSGTYDEFRRALDPGYYKEGLKFYMADDYELQKLFQLGLIGPDAGDGSWNSLWWLGERRMISYGKPMAEDAKSILNLPMNSNERTANLAQYGWVQDRYDGKCYAAFFGIFSLR